MIHIISGTNRPGSNSLKVAKIVEALFNDLNEPNEIIDLKELPLHELDGSQYSKNQPEALLSIRQKLLASRGFFLIVPEYNGSMPGILKYFIDHWAFPDTFEYRPVAYVGLGGRDGGLRPVEHLQQIFGYRNSFNFPERVFLHNVWGLLKDDKITDDEINGLLVQQSKNFTRFIKCLEQAELDANSFLKTKNH